MKRVLARNVRVPAAAAAVGARSRIIIAGKSGVDLAAGAQTSAALFANCESFSGSLTDFKNWATIFFPVIFRIPIDRINWTNSAFLIGTFVLTLTALPLYLWYFGFDWFHFATFAVLSVATGFSITLGYHRLFSHATFRARLPVRLFTLIFGAAAFENSVLLWVSDHRRHHKHVDHDEDPYDITKGFFHAHIGWLLFKLWPEPPLDNVADLQKDPLVMWQHRHIYLLGVLVSFVLPTLLGALWNGWIGALGGFLIGGVAKVVVLQHGTFLINSACHTIGRQPYSTRCSARDSFFMALFTFGEGYHNYHHEFQHDYRNGVKPWQWDPTKWLIWTFSKIGLTDGLRRARAELVSSSEANVRKTVTSEQVMSKAGKTQNEHDLTRETTQES